MQDYKISVIVPVYNAEKYLDNCLNSIVNQTYKNLEVIPVNDGSPDGSDKICDKWKHKDSRIIVQHKENGGVSSARNKGLEIATGEIVAFVDADDYLSLDMYQNMVELLIDYNADCVSCGMVRESQNGYKEVWGSYDADVQVLNTSQILKKIGEANGILPVHVGNKIYKKSILHSVVFDTRFKIAEDTLFNFSVGRKMYKMVLCNKPWYHYTNNESSVSHQKFSNSKLDEHRVMDIIFHMVQDNTEILAYCIKGDVLKSFRTIKEMMVDSACVSEYKRIRKRILSNKHQIFSNGLYSNATKAKTIFLWLLPNTYKLVIKTYGVLANKKYYKKITK